VSRLYPSIIEETLALLGVKSGAVWRLVRRFRAVVEPYAVNNFQARRLSRFLRRVLLKKSENQYSKWVSLCDTLDKRDRQAIRQHIQELKYRPLISILMPVFNTPERWLRVCLDSVVNQLYPDWELCVAEDASTEPDCRKILAEYAERDSRIKITYRSETGTIAQVSNSALQIAEGEFAALVDHDDKLPEHALYMVAVELNEYPEADLIYSDEDKIDENEIRHSPHFKPDWNPDLFCSLNYINHLSVYRISLVLEACGFRDKCLGSQNYDLTLRVMAKSCPWKIRHIPHILYHWRENPGSTACRLAEEGFADTNGRRAIEDYLREMEIDAQVVNRNASCSYRVIYALPREHPMVSVVIPTSCSNISILSRCIKGIIEETEYDNIKCVLVINNFTLDRKYYFIKALEEDHKIKLLFYDKPFNYSAIYNFAVPQTKGEILGLLNDDLQIISSGWLKEMVSHAIRPEIGAVGPILYYPDDTIQHAGIVLGLGGFAGHVHAGLPKGSNGYVRRAQVIQNYSAVTGACLVMRRGVFDEVGGFDVQLPVILNDVDFCMRICKKGYRILWTPHAELYHIEKASRGTEDTPEGTLMRSRATAYMRSKWGDDLLQDPYYNPNLSLIGTSFEISFAPRTQKPWVQIEKR
jgi:O-antigen biosynthesis protein